LTKPEPGLVHEPQSWSPDGQSLLVTVGRNVGPREIHVLSLATKMMTRFSSVVSSVTPEAAFSPDGRWIAYQRSDKEIGAGDIQSYVEPFPSTGAKYLVPLPFAGHPYWSRNRDRLILNVTTSVSNMAMDVRTSPTVTFSQPRPFSRGRRLEPNPVTGRRSVDALPDGRIIGTTGDLGGRGDPAATGTQIDIRLNWVQTLNARMSP